MFENATSIIIIVAIGIVIGFIMYKLFDQYTIGRYFGAIIIAIVGAFISNYLFNVINNMINISIDIPASILGAIIFVKILNIATPNSNK